MSNAKILFQLSGSIACFKSCMLISKLIQTGYEVQTVCTPSAFKFIGTATLEGLTGRTVFSDQFQSGQMMDHIALARWADLAILCPATANSINQIAAGLALNCVGALFLAFDLNKPYLIAPAMNHQMLSSPAVQQSLQKLESWKVQILPTERGRLACGDEGWGRLLEIDAILDRIKDALK